MRWTQLPGYCPYCLDMLQYYLRKDIIYYCTAHNRVVFTCLVVLWEGTG